MYVKYQDINKMEMCFIKCYFYSTCLNVCKCSMWDASSMSLNQGNNSEEK